MFQEFKELVESCTQHEYNDFLYGENLECIGRKTDEGWEDIDLDSLTYTAEVVDSWGGMDEGTNIGAVYN